MFPIKGIEPNEVDVIQKELLNVCHLIEPVYLPVVEPCVYEGKCLLIVWAPGGCERPYRCPERIAKDVKSPKAYYIRKLASTVKATRQDEKELFELTGDVPFDDRPNVHADITDLKMNLLVEYLHEVGSDLAKSAQEMSAADVARNMQLRPDRRSVSIRKTWVSCSSIRIRRISSVAHGLMSLTSQIQRARR